jgi:sugar phosphate isomerase/epimerase
LNPRDVTEHIRGRLSYHAVYEPTIPAALRWAKAAGFRGVQLAIEAPHLAPATLSDDEVPRLASLVRSEALTVSLHAHDRAANLFETAEPLVEGMHAYFRELLEFASAIAARHVTFHAAPAATWPTADRQTSRPDIDQGLYERAFESNMERLLDSSPRGLVLCVEDGPDDPWIRDLCQPYITSGDLGICWDLAGSYDSQGRKRTDLDNWYRRNVSRVVQVHLHDKVDGQGHRVIGTGEVDFVEPLALLAEADVRDFVIEVRPKEAAAESRDNLLEMLSAAQDPPTKRKARRS